MPTSNRDALEAAIQNDAPQSFPSIDAVCQYRKHLQLKLKLFQFIILSSLS